MEKRELNRIFFISIACGSMGLFVYEKKSGDHALNISKQILKIAMAERKIAD